jgi:hypothetical protein
MTRGGQLIGPCWPAVTVSPASQEGGEPATERSLTRSYTTNGDATVLSREG